MKVIKTTWKWSWVVTLPLACLFLLWALNTAIRWHDFGLRYRTVAVNFTLHKAGIMEAQHLLREGQVVIHRRNLEEAIQSSGLRTIHLLLPNSSLGELNSALPDSGFEYMKGSIAFGETLQPAKLRLRGDSVYHWGYWKKSWRVKVERDALFDGMRKFNLIAPRTQEMVNNHLGHRLAARMGLIAPKSELVAMTINGEFDGIQVLTEQMEESTLRRAGRMPGDLYSGDIAGRDVYPGLQPRLFEHPGTWSKTAINNHFDEDSKQPLAELLRLLRLPYSQESGQQLSEMLDLEAFARFSAFEALAGTVHYDADHNWRLFYDPWKTQFVPVVWDPVAWHKDWRVRPGVGFRPDVIASPLHVALFKNGEFLRLREKVFHDFFNNGNSEAFLVEMDQATRALDALVEQDSNMVHRLQVFGPETARAALAKLRSYVGQHFDRLEREHLQGKGSSVRYAVLPNGRLAIETRGRAQVVDVELSFAESVDSPGSSRIHWKEGGPGYSVELGDSQVIGDNRYVLSAGLLSNPEVVLYSYTGRDKRRNHVKFSPAYYEIEVDGIDFRDGLVALRTSSVSGDWKAGERVSKLKPLSLHRGAGLMGRKITPERETWSGVVNLVGHRRLHDLVIKPGTTIRCAPGATLLVTGRLIAEGTDREPIRFLPAEEGQDPWGCLVLKAQGANGSRLKHCTFEGGSGWKQPLAEYSAMVSVHDVLDVQFESCVFASSKIVDDMVHGVYSDIVFKDCLFKDSLSDALDMDISLLALSGCRFENSGNDALDLMTTSATVVGTTFLSSGDKGISVGERSKLVLLQSTLEDCEIGVQAKDESVALIINSDFIANRMAFDAYKKNWRYHGGGHGRLVNCWLEGTGDALQVDKNSSLALSGSFLSGTLKKPDLSNIRYGRDMVGGEASESMRKAESFDFGSTLKDWDLEGPHFLRYGAWAKPERRGRSER